MALAFHDVCAYKFDLVVPGPSPVRLVSPDGRAFDGWRPMYYDEVREWQEAARASYVVRPYCPHEGSLGEILTPADGGLTVGTAHIHRHIPVPHELLPYPRTRNRTVRGLVLSLNSLLPVTVTRRPSMGTAAIVDTGRGLPSIDLLPEPMRWESHLRIDRRRALPWLSKDFGRERNLPSGVRLRPVPLPFSHSDEEYFAPLAADPGVATAALSPELLAYTRECGVAWWSDGSILFVWTHKVLWSHDRRRLVESAQRIHGLLTAERRPGGFAA